MNKLSKKRKSETLTLRSLIFNKNNDNSYTEKFNEIYNNHLIFKKSELKNKLLNEFENEINSKLKIIENTKNYFGKKIVYKQLEIVFENVEKIEKNLIFQEIKIIKGLKDNSKEILNSLFTKITKKELNIFLYKTFKYLNYKLGMFYIRKNYTTNFEFIHDKYLDIREDSIYQIYNNNCFNPMNTSILKVKSRRHSYFLNDSQIKKNYDINKNKIRNLLFVANNRKTNILFFQDIGTRDLKQNIKKYKNKNLRLDSNNLFISGNLKQEKILDYKNKKLNFKNLFLKLKYINFFQFFKKIKKKYSETNLIGDLKYQKIKNNFYKSIFYHIEKNNEIQLKKIISDNLGFLNINYTDENGNTFLNFASQLNSNIEIVEFLLLYGCSPNLCNVIIFFFNF